MANLGHDANERRVMIEEIGFTLSGDHKILVDSSDTIAGYLAEKIKEGTNISLVIENVGGNERIRVDLGANAATKTYVDSGDANTLAAADSHADSGDTATLASADTHADAGDTATLASANNHADTGDASTLAAANTHSDTGDTNTLASANSHADSGDASTLAAANSHADSGDTTILATAETYTDAAIAAINAGGNFALMYYGGSGLDGDYEASSGTLALTGPANFYNITLTGTARINTNGHWLRYRGILDLTEALMIGAIYYDAADGGNGGATGTAG